MLEGSEYGSKSCFEMVDKPQCCSFSMGGGGEQMVGQRTSLQLQINEEIFPEWTRQTVIYQRKGVSSGTCKDLFPRAWGLLSPCLTKVGAPLSSPEAEACPMWIH